MRARRHHRVVRAEHDHDEVGWKVRRGQGRTVVRAQRWFDDLVSGRARSLCDIARAECVTDRYVSHLLRLAFLAPQIAVAIREGAQPVVLTIEALTKRIDLPLAWMEQKSRLGFDRR